MCLCMCVLAFLIDIDSFFNQLDNDITQTQNVAAVLKRELVSAQPVFPFRIKVAKFVAKSRQEALF